MLGRDVVRRRWWGLVELDDNDIVVDAIVVHECTVHVLAIYGMNVIAFSLQVQLLRV